MRTLFCTARALLYCLPVFILGACATPQVGQACGDGSAYCGDAGVALSCQSGALVAFPCTGPKGCAVAANRTVMCDQSVGETAGAPCFPIYNGLGECAPGGLLTCTNGTWALAACAQGTSCQAVDGGVACK